MATANSSINIAELDFDQIKNNLIQYLSKQDKFSDYKFENSVISTVLDILAYNTHYNAYYLNMVANESFLDTAVKRSSTVSHAKLMNYTPSSKRAAKASINIKFNGVGSSEIVIPKYTKFYSKSIDNANYSFVTLDSILAPASNGVVQFYSIPIYQGQPVRYTFNANLMQNPTSTFTIPDADIDTTTLTVLVYDSIQSTVFNKFELASNHLTLDNTSQVYFLQEGLDGNFQIYFGDGVLGKSLVNGNVITVEYIITKGDVSNGAYQFTLMDKIGNYTGAPIINATEVAYGGQNKESIQSIKYSAPKSYSSQNRAVTKSDYLDLLKKDNPIIPIQAVNVWGGEDMTPPQFGKMFICIKPNGGYSLTASQKYRLINEYIRPYSVITIIPEIVDVDYTFLKLSTNIYFDKNRSIYDAVQLSSVLKLSILDFCNRTLNTFDSMFILPDLITTIKEVDTSIITCESTVSLQKRFLPIFRTTNAHTFKFETAIKRGTLDSDYFDYLDSNGNIIQNAKVEESPSVFNTIESVQVVSGGGGYTSVPTITIYGDGTGAVATADVVNGVITAINVTTPGLNYTQAVVVISGGGGTGAAAVAVLSGNRIKLRTYYYANNIKTILQNDVGEINYTTGIVTLSNFVPYNINNLLGQFSITVTPESTLFTSTQDKIITLDIMDNTSITINVKPKV